MKNAKTLIILSSFLIVAGCKPGPITLGGGQPAAVETTPGKVVYTNYSVDKKRRLTIPAGLKGSDLTTARIKAAYAEDPLLSNYKIHVETHRGVVKLSGAVPSDQARSYAIKIARFNKGVLAVDAKNLVITH